MMLRAALPTVLLLAFAAMPLPAAASRTSEFIYEQAPFPSCHASTIVETRSGDLLAAWFGGTKEGAPDVAIWMSRKHGDVWSAPQEMAREAGVPTYNPVLFYANDGRLWLYYKFGTSPSNWTGARRLSTDDGQTWAAIEHLPAGLYGPIKDKPLVLKDGTIVSGTSVESYHSWAAWVERSRDQGATWTKHGPITVDPSSASGSNNETTGVIQPAVVSLPDGRLRMYLRSTRNIGRICYADSSDGGVTWSKAQPTSLPNPNSGIDAVSLKDGRIALIYNHTTQGRTPLNLAISRDGEHWTQVAALETEPGEYSYPAIIQGRGGELHITYTYHRQKIKHVAVPLKDLEPEAK